MRGDGGQSSHAGPVRIETELARNENGQPVQCLRQVLRTLPPDPCFTSSVLTLSSRTSDMEFDFPSGNIGKMREEWTSVNVGSLKVPKVAQGPCICLVACHLTEHTVHQDAEEPVCVTELRAIALVVINRWKFSAMTKAFDSCAALTLVSTLLVLLALSLAIYCSGQLHQMRLTPCLRPPCPVI